MPFCHVGLRTAPTFFFPGADPSAGMDGDKGELIGGIDDNVGGHRRRISARKETKGMSNQDEQ